ncbi:hypothetical protein BJV82DRAFT_668512 [Fennellomyces sp. T-0311]|nr:hypothetical protein BJV82DRAFT_668512 [Fennellomyces sp. T-0311]
MIRRTPTAITLDISDVEDFDDLKRMLEEEKAWQAEMATNKAAGDREVDYLLDRTLTKASKADNNTAESSNSFLAKRRRIASSSTSQRRAEDARKRLGVDGGGQGQEKYKMGRQA